MGGWWQTSILTHCDPLFADIPLKSFDHEHQSEYYAAWRESTVQIDSAPFVEFMLTIIRDAVITTIPQVTRQVRRLLAVIQGDMTRDVRQDILKLQDRKSLQSRYLKPAWAVALIEMTIPGKPTSRLQKYRLTEKGCRGLQQNGVWSRHDSNGDILLIN